MAVSASISIFRQVAPAFSLIEDDDVGEWIQLATNQHSAVAWNGGTFDQAMAYYAAHMMEVTPGLGSGAGGLSGGSSAGPITSKRTGDQQVSFGSASSGVTGIGITDAELMQTSYGRRYLALRQRRAATLPTFVKP